MTPEAPPTPTPPGPTPPPPTPPPPEVVITRIPYPKWWKELNTAKISLSGAGTQQVIPARGGWRIYIATIVFTVSDETNISLYFGTFGYSGSMDFGGGGEPKGIVIAMGNSPAPCGQGPFNVSSDGATTAVGGFVTYYLEEE